MDDEGIQNVWNANVRTRPASSTATRIVTTASVRGRRGPVRAGPVPAGPGSAGPAMPGFPDDRLRAARGAGHNWNGPGRAGPALRDAAGVPRAPRLTRPRRAEQPRRDTQ